MNITVNISDAKVSGSPDAVLVTHSLGSCIGITLYDPAVRAGGMLHFQLPTSTLDADRARQNPLMFADTGMAWLLDQLVGLGARKPRLRVALAGGAQMLDDGGVFSVGRRNHAAIRKLLWQHGLMIAGEDVGGSSPRNLYLNIADGTVTVRTGPVTRTL